MKKLTISLIIVMAFTFFIPGLHAGGTDIAGIFPGFEDWTKKGKPDLYTPDNLFEYINGAAEVFLSYDFVKLATVGDLPEGIAQKAENLMSAISKRYQD